MDYRPKRPGSTSADAERRHDREPDGGGPRVEWCWLPGRPTGAMAGGYPPTLRYSLRGVLARPDWGPQNTIILENEWMGGIYGETGKTDRLSNGSHD